jgi:hypothetical protein
MATKPVTSVIRELYQIRFLSRNVGGIAHFWNSMEVVVVAASTVGQFPAQQETLFPGESLFEIQ